MCFHNTIYLIHSLQQAHKVYAECLGYAMVNLSSFSNETPKLSGYHRLSVSSDAREWSHRAREWSHKVSAMAGGEEEGREQDRDTESPGSATCVKLLH